MAARAFGFLLKRPNFTETGEGVRGKLQITQLSQASPKPLFLIGFAVQKQKRQTPLSACLN